MQLKVFFLSFRCWNMFFLVYIHLHLSKSKQCIIPFRTEHSRHMCWCLYLCSDLYLYECMSVCQDRTASVIFCLLCIFFLHSTHLRSEEHSNVFHGSYLMEGTMHVHKCAIHYNRYKSKFVLLFFRGYNISDLHQQLRGSMAAVCVIGKLHG